MTFTIQISQIWKDSDVLIVSNIILRNLNTIILDMYKIILMYMIEFFSIKKLFYFF